MAKKLTFYMIATLLDLAIKGVKGAIRAINVIRDLMDDGKLNGSADVPAYLEDLLPVLDQLECVLDALKSPAAAAGSFASDIIDEINGHA